jgi:hypothetical protein
MTPGQVDDPGLEDELGQARRGHGPSLRHYRFVASQVPVIGTLPLHDTADQVPDMVAPVTVPVYWIVCEEATTPNVMLDPLTDPSTVPSSQSVPVNVIGPLMELPDWMKSIAIVPTTVSYGGSMAQVPSHVPVRSDVLGGFGWLGSADSLGSVNDRLGTGADGPPLEPDWDMDETQPATTTSASAPRTARLRRGVVISAAPR